jgi:hypothetical protein
MPRGIASNQIKLLIAGVLALAGAAVAVRGLIPARSERTDAPKPSIVTADGSPPPAPQTRQAPPGPEEMRWTQIEEAGEYDFPRVSSAEDAREMAASIGQRAGQDPAARDGLGDDLTAFLAPALSGAELSEAMHSLGSAGQDTAGLEAILGTLLKHASADVDRITVASPKEPLQAIGGLNVSRNRSAEPGPDGVDVERETTTLTTSLERHFPDAFAKGASGPLVTVEIPFRSKGGEGPKPDLLASITLRYSPTAMAWQPVLASFGSTDAELSARVMNELRAIAAARKPEGQG